VSTKWISPTSAIRPNRRLFASMTFFPTAQTSSGFSDLVGPTITFGLFIALWYLISNVVLPKQKRFLLPVPHKVVSEGFLRVEDG